MKRGFKVNDIDSNVKNKKVNRKRKPQSDDEEFILIESDKDNESEHNPSAIEDDDDMMMIDDNLKEGLKLDQNNNANVDDNFVENERTTKVRMKRGRKPKNTTKTNQSKKQKSVSKKKIYICN